MKVNVSFTKSRVTFLGHVIDENGISSDPKKTAAIQEMPQPSSITELRRFMGMVNQMSKFSPNIAHLSKPLRELLSSKAVWTWTVAQNDAFLKLKEEISLPGVLAFYDTEATTKVRVVLLQLQKGLWRPVAPCPF